MDKYEQTRALALSLLPAFFPDETLYSLCARFHSLSANRLAATTSLQLFGVATAAMLHDFPTHLTAFEIQTKARLGDAVRLARDRTLLGFYAPYQPHVRIAAAAEAMAGAGVDRLKFRIGLPSSRIGATHPLKACTRCIQEELEQLGCAYWHLIQQHPSVWICTKHDELLMQSMGKSKTHNKLQWILPHALPREEWKHLPDHYKKQTSLLARLDEFVRGICAAGTPHLDPSALRQCYLFGAKSAGWLTRNGNVRLRAVREAFMDQAIGLLGIPEFDFIESADREDGGFLGKLFRTARSYLHPTKHLILKTFLFGSWSEFWKSYSQMVAAPCQATSGSQFRGSESDSKAKELLSLIASGELSLAQVARTLEIPYDVARYWLKRAGVRYDRRSLSNKRSSS